MISPLQSHTSGPVLAVELGRRSVKALFFPPEQGEPRVFVLPGSDAAYAARARLASTERRPLHLLCSGFSHPPFSFVQERLDAGTGFSLHPASAALLTATRDKLTAKGAVISEQAPPGAVTAPHAEPDPAFWERLCAMCGLPRPERFLYTATEWGRPLDIAGPEARALCLEAFFADSLDGAGVREMLRLPSDARAVRLRTLERAAGVAATDAFAAAMLGFCALPAVAGRSLREGVLALHMGAGRIRAGLLFRSRLFAALELPLAAFFPEHAAPEDGLSGVLKNAPARERLASLLALLDDFRLGWLPPETARNLGGQVCCPFPPPAEAEGFKPAFISGPNASLLAGHGMLAAGTAGAGAMHACMGLLYGYGMLPDDASAFFRIL